MDIAGTLSFATPQTAANDTTAPSWDRRDLLTFIEALAEYTADLLMEGRLDESRVDPGLPAMRDTEMAFTRAGKPSIK